MIFIAYFVKYDTKTSIFLKLKTILKKNIINFNFFQLNYVGTHFVMTLWAFDGHWMQKTLDFKLMLQTCEIDLFTYPILSKGPAEIALPVCEWQQVKTLSDMTWEHIGTIKLIKSIIKSDIYNLFYLNIW